MQPCAEQGQARRAKNANEIEQRAVKNQEFHGRQREIQNSPEKSAFHKPGEPKGPLIGRMLPEPFEQHDHARMPQKQFKNQGDPFVQGNEQKHDLQRDQANRKCRKAQDQLDGKGGG